MILALELCNATVCKVTNRADLGRHVVEIVTEVWLLMNYLNFLQAMMLKKTKKKSK